ncbi:MAG TPA: hypothetical protein VK431_00810, partial [Nitrosopumilaceae archaeon]|nr:hypothetical protein [Nitrosopumilaceae archaeon]
RLEQISRTIKSGQNLDESDAKYLREKSRHLEQVVDCKTKVTKTREASKKLQEVETKHSQKLQEIQNAAENGKLVSEREQRYLNARYEKFQKALDYQNKVEWTIQTIQRLEDFGVGDPTRLDKIKELLEDDLPVPEHDVMHLREEYQLLRQMIKYKRKIDWTIKMINELQEMEIGNPERLSAIKKALEQRRPIAENEINYLTDKCKILLMAKKSSDYELDNENNTEKIPYDSILAELNIAIKESEKLESKLKVA